MLGIIFSIGAINALIPIIVILILIAAAAGSTRGSKLFEMFGISALLGMSVGRGTLQKQSPFKSKRFSSDKNPFRKVAGQGMGLAGNKAQQLLNKAAVARANNLSFKNLGGSGLTSSGFAHQQVDNKVKDLASRGLSSTFTDKQEGRVRTAIDTHLTAHEQGFRIRKQAAIKSIQQIKSNPALTPAEKADKIRVENEGLKELQKEHNIVMSKGLEKLNTEIGKITGLSKETPVSKQGLSIRNQLRVTKFEHLSAKIKEAQINLAQLSNRESQEFSNLEKLKLSPQKLEWQRQREIERLKEHNEEIRKLENDNPKLKPWFDAISSTRSKNVSSDVKNAILNSELRNAKESEGLVKDIMNVKKYHKENK